MSMRQTIAVISQMEADGIIGRYAIGGAVAVGRPKDHARLTQFIEAGRYDAQYFCEILDRHGLAGKWRAFC